MSTPQRLLFVNVRKPPSVSVVFVSYNSGGVLPRAIASVPETHQVVVVDNASPEGTNWVEGLQRPVDLLRLETNRGFGTACNAGARAARGDYVLFLNPDAVLEAGTIPTLLEAVKRYGDPGIFMPSIIGENGRPMRKEGSILEPVPRKRRLKAQEMVGDYCTRFVHGAAFLMERRAFLAMGGFDEAIFLYHEDDDLALRALRSYIPITVVADARVVHAGGKSSTASWRQTFRISRFKKHSERYVLGKYGASRGKAAECLYLAAGCLLSVLMFDIHRLMIRSGKIAGLFDTLPSPPEPSEDRSQGRPGDRPGDRPPAMRRP
ncbi:glycosyl transferase [Azorhizobium oxalatiphilum]|uniref:Glycosyl transferase n=1 Tax=Azorhizobium oxalatiphilum TaxID=980631 RepID=A0A917BPF4_9HYPH|nr:glycosyltransferase family 2 protein [Azorhizobium oxalatiphilum]GGF53883.1 glycosyl transferase [Azorhizobium oxalatiphilum]